MNGRAFARPFRTNGGWSFRREPDLFSHDHQTLTAFLTSNGSDGIFRRASCSCMQREGVNGMENLFLTTLLISVVIGVLIIYHVTPEG
jgi:hypothetical protein